MDRLLPFPLRRHAGKADEGYDMIIQAADRFVCAHRWVATATVDGDHWLLVCDGCGHRTEQLPLTKLDQEMGSSGQVLSSRHLFQKQRIAGEASLQGTRTKRTARALAKFPEPA